MQNGDAMQKNQKCMRCQLHRMHNRRTIWSALTAFKGNIYQYICSQIVLEHIYKNIEI
jgi:hypothetical protein